MARPADRDGMTPETRIRLIEVDLDKIDAAILQLDESIDAMREHLDNRLGKLMQVGVSLLSSFAVACVLLVLNLIAGG